MSDTALAFSALKVLPSSLSALGGIVGGKNSSALASAAFASTGLLLALRLSKAAKKKRGITSSTAATPIEQQFRREEKLNATEAAICAACELADVHFVYALNAVTKIEACVAKRLAELPHQNAKVHVMETRSGAGNIVVGAAAAGALPAIHLSGDALVSHLASISALLKSNRPAVFHVSAQIVSNTLEVKPSHAAIMAARSAGAIILASRTSQESYDMAIAAHALARATSRPVIHAYDGGEMSRDMELVRVLSRSELARLDSQSSSFASVAPEEALQGITRSEYAAFDYYGARDARVVIIAFGWVSRSFDERVAYLLRMHGDSVGVINVRLLAPFSQKAFLAALPSTADTVCVVDSSDGDRTLFKLVTMSLGRGIKIVSSTASSSDGKLAGVLCDRIIHNAQSENPALNLHVESSICAPRPSLEIPSQEPKEESVSRHQFAWQMMFPERYAACEAIRPQSKVKVFKAKVKKNIRLTPLDYHRNIFHLELDISQTGLTYQIGDALGVYGQNRHQDVSQFLDAYGLQGEAFVDIDASSATREVLTVKQLFTRHLDLFGKPSKKFYMQLADYARDDYEHHKLRWLGSADYQEGYKLRHEHDTLTYADVLLEFTSAKLTIPDFLAIVPPIKPRHYSIASSFKANPGSVHLLVVVVEWKDRKGRQRFGQCSKYLADVKFGDEVAVDIMPSILRLPKDHSRPIIMSGLGTGLAPFRAFIQERAFLKSQGENIGPMTLYFGARYRAQEFLYGKELEEYERRGILKLRLAFSRDQKHKVYIQDLIKQDRDIIAQRMLAEGGHFYLCGPTWPVPDVTDALLSGFESKATSEEAKAQLETVKKEGRFTLEVY